MKIKNNHRLKSNLILSTYIIVLSYILLNISTVINALSYIFFILKPILIGIAIAFVLNIPMSFFERNIFSKVFKKHKKINTTKLKRPISLLTTLIAVVGILVTITIFLVPQLIESGSTLVENVPQYLDSLEDVLNEYISDQELFKNLDDKLLSIGKETLTFVGNITTSVFEHVLNLTISVTSTIVNFVISFIVAVYILLSKEKLILQIKKLLYAFVKRSAVERVLWVGRICNKKFSKFVTGQCLEACILGMLCFIGMKIFSMPYAVLIGTLIGVTALIPIVGAFLGLIPSTFIIFMIDPTKAIWFVILIIVIQQIEGNLIYPFVVGNSIGLSALWVLSAITIGGNISGILGMLLGVPTCGIVYVLCSYITNKRLEEKNIYFKDGEAIDLNEKNKEEKS